MDAPRLEGFLRVNYYQAVWDFFSSNEEIWEDYLKRLKDKNRVQELLDDLQKIKSWGNSDILNFINNACDGMEFDNADEASKFLEKMYAFFSEKV